MACSTMLCLYHESMFMREIIPITDLNHLQRCIEIEIAEQGLTANLNHLDVSRVTQLDRLFERSKFNGDISEWNTSNVTSMIGVFQDSEFNGDISRWDVANVYSFARMFKNAQFNNDISQWQMNHADNMLEMFQGSHFNGDISRWNLTKVKEFRGMFQQSAFAGDLSQIRLRRFSVFGNMFDHTFEGVLPFSGDGDARAKIYASLIGGTAELRTYLKNVAFNTVHLDILLHADKKPGWAKASDYAWVKEFAAMAKSLELDDSQMRAMAVRNYHDRTLTAIPLPALDSATP